MVLTDFPVVQVKIIVFVVVCFKIILLSCLVFVYFLSTLTLTLELLSTSCSEHFKIKLGLKIKHSKRVVELYCRNFQGISNLAFLYKADFLLTHPIHCRFFQ